MPADAAAPSPSVPDLQRRVDELAAELRARTSDHEEALRREAAVAEILQVTNASGGDLALVFGAMLEKATRLCSASYGYIWTYDGESVRPVAVHGDERFEEWLLQSGPLQPGPESPLGRALSSKRPVHVIDATEEETYRNEARFRDQMDRAGIRTLLHVPLRKDDRVLGVITVYRRDRKAFTDQQIRLLESFAEQAVIAMESSRLLAELGQRTGDLQESLEYQTATSEVIQLISRSTFDLAPVLQTLAEMALRLCEAEMCFVVRREGEAYRVVTAAGATPELLKDARDYQQHQQAHLLVPGRGSLTGRVALAKQAVQIADLAADPEFTLTAAITMGKIRTQLGVPLLREGVLIGVIVLSRQRVAPFVEQQIRLAQTFADQAVIAIENTRLLTEQRDALEQQTANAEILQVINSSPGDLKPVFQSVLEKALRLCEAAFGVFWMYDGKQFHASAVLGLPDDFTEFISRSPREPGPHNALGVVLRGDSVVRIEDAAASEAYRLGDPMRRAMVDLGGARTALGIALRKDEVLLGMLMIYRQEVRPFTDRQVTLLENFAAHAVIAMENARLIDEQRQALEQQTATSEVLQVINSSPGDLAPVFDAMLERAMTLCGAAFGFLTTYDGERFSPAAMRGVPPALAEYFAAGMDQPSPGEAHARLLEGEDVVHDLDQKDEEAYRSGNLLRRAVVDLGGARSALVVALRKDEVVLGALTIYRKEVRPFSDKEIGLMKNFAAQAVIAMENARLLVDLRQRTGDLEESLEYQTATSDVLKVISRATFDLQAVLNTLSKTAARLCAAELSFMTRHEGDAYRFVTAVGSTPETTQDAIRLKRDFLDRYTFKAGRDSITGRVISEAQVVQIVDVAADPEYKLSEINTIGKIRTLLGVPMVREGLVIGTMSLGRQRIEPFTEKQIELIRTFADQAVIAIENARLLTETRESLERQTATAEVLEVINSSPGDPQPVFDAMLERAVRLSESAFGMMNLYEDNRFRGVALRGVPSGVLDWSSAPQPGPNSALTRLVNGEDVVHIEDLKAYRSYHEGDQRTRNLVDVGGARSLLAVALRKDGALLGTITAYRQEVRPFSDKQIVLLENFGAQAVIAIENARLLNELRQRSAELARSVDELTATGDVLKIISRSSVDLETVLDTLVETVARLCRADHAYMFRRDDELYHLVAACGLSEEERAFVESHPFAPDRGTVSGRVTLERRTVHITDALLDPEYNYSGQKVVGFRTLLGIPLLREDTLVGVFVVSRTRVEPFSSREIELATSFADQAVIAIENTRLLTEQREALEQQTATAEVLQVINSSPGNIEPVFAVILEKAMHICDASFGGLWTFEADRYVAAALHGGPKAFAEFLRATTDVPGPGTAPYRFLRGERSVIQNIDLAAEEPYRAGDPQRRALVDLGGARTALQVPLCKDDTVIGVVTIYRQEVRAFTERQIALLQNFAAQAVVAMENARLFEELRDREAELRVTFDNMGDGVAMFDAEPRLVAWNRNFEEIIGLPEPRLAERPSYPDYLRLLAERGEFGTENVEAELARRLENTDRELRLERMRADGTVIEVRRNAVPGGGFVLIYSDITERRRAEAAIRAARDAAEAALERQTATADVLRVIASSPSDVQPVFESIVESAKRLASSQAVTVTRVIGDMVQLAAFTAGSEAGHKELQSSFPTPLSSGGIHSRVARAGKLAFRTDIETDPDVSQGVKDLARARGYRSILVVPMLRENVSIGTIGVTRREPGPFEDKVIDVLTTFAAQAVIAIENVRLFTELKESLEQQTATAEILRAISQSPTDVQPVLEAVVKAAVRFCGATDAMIQLRDGDSVIARAHEGPLTYSAGDRRSLDRSAVGGRAMVDARTCHVPDIEAPGAADLVTARRLAARHGFRAAVGAPLKREGTAVGAVVLRKVEPGPFTPQQIALLETFAAQAVIAIENVRLFTELRDSLERLKAAQANLIQSEKMASLGQLTAGIAHEIKNPLNFVNNFAALSAELLTELKEIAEPVLAGMGEDEHAGFAETIDMITGNLEKIAEHGKRADGIVKSMLSHSRGGTGDWQESNIDALVEEALNLAYHGARAQDKEFNVTLERDFAAATTPIEVVPQDVTRVFLNLFGNGFYAANKRRLGGAGSDYRPTLRVSTRDLGDAVEVGVRDNGTGIPPEMRDKLFQPFFTTKPTGEGTGLGLSISYDIVTQQHGGTIEVESEPGAFTEFTVRLPRSRRAAQSRGA